MNSEIIVALFSLAGTLIGSLFGVITSNKLVNYRLQQLEEKLSDIGVLDRRMDELEKRQIQSETTLNTLPKEIERIINDIKDIKANDRNLI